MRHAIFLILLVILVTILGWALVHVDLPKPVFGATDVDPIADAIVASTIEYDPSIIPSQDLMAKQSTMYIEYVDDNGDR